MARYFHRFRSDRNPIWFHGRTASAPIHLFPDRIWHGIDPFWSCFQHPETSSDIEQHVSKTKMGMGWCFEYFRSHQKPILFHVASVRAAIDFNTTKQTHFWKKKKLMIIVINYSRLRAEMEIKSQKPKWMARWKWRPQFQSGRFWSVKIIGRIHQLRKELFPSSSSSSSSLPPPSSSYLPPERGFERAIIFAPKCRDTTVLMSAMEESEFQFRRPLVGRMCWLIRNDDNFFQLWFVHFPVEVRMEESW